MSEFLETTVDKFTFKVAADRLYSSEGVWIKEEAGHVRLGLTDFVQQRNGDVAFADVKPVGSVLAVRDEMVSIETIKVTISFTSPISGKIIAVNPVMDNAPEVINQDPFGSGWLVLLEPADWDIEKGNLLDPQAYFEIVKGQAEEETKKQ